MVSNDFLNLAEKIKNVPAEHFWKLYEKRGYPELIKARAYYDLKFFAELFFSETVYDTDGRKYREGHTKDGFNRMHLEYFKDFVPDEKKEKKVIQAARGSAKTTLFALIDPLHRICFNNEKYILIMSSTTPLARLKSKDIHREVELNEKLQEFFGLDFGEKRTSKESFLVSSQYGDCYIHSQGFFSQIRGAKYGSQRPTRMIFDDVTHGERVFSEEQRDKAERQFKTDILQASQPNTNHIFIGTTIHAEDLLNRLVKNPTWRNKKYVAIEKWPVNMNLWEDWEQIYKDPTLEQEKRAEKAQKFYEKHETEMNKGAKVLWPEREDLLYLMIERLNIGRRAFGAEKQMQPFLTGEALFQKISWFYPDEKNGMPGYYIEKTGKFVEYESSRFQRYYALDPSTGERKKQTQKKKLSQSARIVASKDLDTGKIFVDEAIMDRKPPSTIIYEMYTLHNLYNFVRMGFEENLFRDLFRDHLESVKEQWRNENGFAPDLPWFSIWADQKKEQRIYTIEPLVSQGTILFNKHMNPDFLTQLQDYPNCDHNDGLDALEIISKIADPRTKLTAFSFSHIVNR